MNAADLVIIGAVGLLALMGLKSGLLTPASGIGGLILGIIIAINHSHSVVPMLAEYIDGERLQRIAAFIAVVLAVAIATRLVAALIKGLLSALVLGWLDHVAGAAAGAALGIVIVGTGVYLLGRMEFGPTKDVLAASKLGPQISQASLISAFAPECASPPDAASASGGCPDLKAFLGKMTGVDVTEAVGRLEVGNLAGVVKGALTGAPPEELAGLVLSEEEIASLKSPGKPASDAKPREEANGGGY